MRKGGRGKGGVKEVDDTRTHIKRDTEHPWLKDPNDLKDDPSSFSKEDNPEGGPRTEFPSSESEEPTVKEIEDRTNHRNLYKQNEPAIQCNCRRAFFLKIAPSSAAGFELRPQGESIPWNN